MLQKEESLNDNSHGEEWAMMSNQRGKNPF